MMKKVFTVLLVSFLATVAWAQANDGATKVWTLKECVDYALANSLDIQRSHYNVENSEINYDLSRASMIPSLNAGVTNGYNWGRSINPVTNEFTTQQIRSLSPNINGSVTLFNGLRIQNTIKQNAREYQASE